MQYTTKFQPFVLATIAMFTSSDETRYAITGIKVEATPESVKLIATDGRRLIVFSEENMERPKSALSFIIPNVLLALMPQETPILRIPWELSFDGETITIDANDYKITGRAIDATYPNYNEVIPNPLPTAFPQNIQLHCEFLAELAQVINLLNGPNNPQVALSQGDEYGPLVAKFVNGLICQMPMRKKEAA